MKTGSKIRWQGIPLEHRLHVCQRIRVLYRLNRLETIVHQIEKTKQNLAHIAMEKHSCMKSTIPTRMLLSHREVRANNNKSFGLSPIRQGQIYQHILYCPF